MKNWTNTQPGYRTKVITGDGYTVNIHRPELTAETRTRREREVTRVLAGMRGGATA